MKQHVFFKSSRTLLMGMLGALMPLTAAHALDFLDRVHDEKLNQASVSVTEPEKMMTAEPPAAGSQATITSSDRGTEYDRELQRRNEQAAAAKKDIERRFYPVGGSDSP